MPSYEIRLPSYPRRTGSGARLALWAMLTAVLAASIGSRQAARAVPLATPAQATAALRGLAAADSLLAQRGRMAVGAAEEAAPVSMALAARSPLVADGSVEVDCGCPSTARLQFLANGRALAQVDLVHGRALRFAPGGPRGLVRLTPDSARSLCALLADQGLPVGEPQWAAR